MARHRKIDVRVWGDERVRRLSSIPPCGQGLWFYLLTCPSSTSVPGLFTVGRPQLADELGWTTEDFDEAFQEVFGEGLLKADWKARVVWIPGSWKYNTPESPNVVKSWRVHLDEVPECSLKSEAIRSLRAACKALGEPFAKAFEKASPKPKANQEQEQEQDKRSPLSTTNTSSNPPVPANEQSGSRAGDQSIRLGPISPEGTGYNWLMETLQTIPPDKDSWKSHYRTIGAKSETERLTVARNVRDTTWAMDNIHDVTPEHVLKYWASYLAGPRNYEAKTFPRALRPSGPSPISTRAELAEAAKNNPKWLDDPPANGVGK